MAKTQNRNPGKATKMASGSKGKKGQTQKQQSGPWYVMTRGGKWLTVTAGAAAVSTAATLAVSKLGEKAAAPDAPAGPPIVVASVSAMAGGGGSSFAFDRAMDLNAAELAAIQDGGPNDRHDQYLHWAVARGGVIADEDGSTMIQLTLRGNRKDQIRILDMQALPKCRNSLVGTLFYSPNAGEGDAAALGFDLDKLHSPAKQYNQDKGFGEDYFPAKTISLDYKEQQVVSLYAKTRQFCEFRVRLKILVGDLIAYEVIGNASKIGGKVPPFRVTKLLSKGDESNFTGNAAFSAYRDFYAGGVATSICRVPGTWVEMKTRSVPREGDC